jgi:hypothetical protein
MRAPGRKVRRLVTVGAGPVAVLLAGGMIWQGSYAAFSADTRNSGNSWSSGTVTLTDDDAGSSRFTVTDLVPGQTETKCIKVTATSSLAGTVKLYLLNPVTSTAGLESHIKLTITSGTGGTFASCTGYSSTAALISAQSLAAVTSTYNNYANGAGEWVTTGNPAGETKTYQLAWTFDTTGMTQEQLDGLQGSHVGVDFEWEMQNN